MRTLVIVLIAAVLILGVVGCKSGYRSGCACGGTCVLDVAPGCAPCEGPAREYRTGIQCDYCTSDMCVGFCR